MQNDGQDRKPSKKGLITLLIVLTVVGAAAGFIYMDTFYGAGKLQGYFSQVFQNGEHSQTQENPIVSQGKMAIDESSRSTFVTYGERFLLCTKDGVKYFNEMGDRKWNDTFNMTMPQMVSEGNYVAVGDMNGKTIGVYGEEGLLYAVQIDGELIQFALNANGYLSVISKESSAYRIQIYNGGGTLLKGRVEESEGVFPLSSDISDDNKSFVVSYMDTSDIEPIGRVLFFYINPGDSENYTDSMFAAVEKNSEVLPIIGFMQGGMLAAISDQAVYGISSGGEEAWNYPLNNRIQQFSLSNKEFVVLALGDALANKEGRPEGTVCWIDRNGKETANYESGGTVSYLHSSEKGVVIGVDKEFFGLGHSGRLSWSYRATSDIRDILPMESLERVMIVTKNEAIITEMKGIRTARPLVPNETKTEHEVVGGTAEKEIDMPADSTTSEEDGQSATEAKTEVSIAE